LPVPELPEVTRARLLRRDIAVAPGDPAGGFSRQQIASNSAAPTPVRILPADLLQGARVAAIDRRGKRMVIRAESGQALGVHLGMTGHLLFCLPASACRITPTRLEQEARPAAKMGQSIAAASGAHPPG
jgi:formamidopyrimidine-DNA glycosylase